MTTAAIVVSRCAPARTTAFERALLRFSSWLDRFVALRAERRATAAYRFAADAIAEADAVRRAAEARAAVGILPR